MTLTPPIQPPREVSYLRIVLSYVSIVSGTTQTNDIFRRRARGKKSGSGPARESREVVGSR